MGSTNPVDVVGDERYGWWSEDNFAHDGRVMVYYLKQSVADKEAGKPPVEVKVTGVTSTPDRVGYKWKDSEFRGELEPLFVRVEDPRFQPQLVVADKPPPT